MIGGDEWTIWNGRRSFWRPARSRITPGPVGFYIAESKSEQAWNITEAYLRGYEAGRGVREMCEIEKGTARTAGWWVCKSCGTPFDMVGALACKEEKKPNYCPRCGRKVVSE